MITLKKAQQQSGSRCSEPVPLELKGASFFQREVRENNVLKSRCSYEEKAQLAEIDAS